MRDYRKLEVWKKAHAFVIDIYRRTAFELPMEEQSDLVGQIKKAAYFIPVNIMEGCSKWTNRDFCRCLIRALASAHEAEYGLLLMQEMNYFEIDFLQPLLREIGEIKAMLTAFINFHQQSKRKRL
jgi:four helix bundle protein